MRPVSTAGGRQQKLTKWGNKLSGGPRCLREACLIIVLGCLSQGCTHLYTFQTIEYSPEYIEVTPLESHRKDVKASVSIEGKSPRLRLEVREVPQCTNRRLREHSVVERKTRHRGLYFGPRGWQLASVQAKHDDFHPAKYEASTEGGVQLIIEHASRTLFYEEHDHNLKVLIAAGAGGGGIALGSALKLWLAPGSSSEQEWHRGGDLAIGLGVAALSAAITVGVVSLVLEKKRYAPKVLSIETETLAASVSDCESTEGARAYQGPATLTPEGVAPPRPR